MCPCMQFSYAEGVSAFANGTWGVTSFRRSLNTWIEEAEPKFKKNAHAGDEDGRIIEERVWPRV